jgi:hypothetical protein
MRMLRTACFLILSTVLPVVCSHADKLKNFYIGSGGFSASVHRIVLLELAKDGTAVLQQNWHDKDPEVWHVHWKLDGKTLTLSFDPVVGKPTPSDATFTLKNNSLVPVKFDSHYLGLLGPPTLMPFHTKAKPPGSVSGCQMVDYSQPTGCVQWDSRNLKK